MKLREDLKEMSPYEKWKLRVDFLRFIATMMAPVMVVVFTYIAKKYLGW